MLSHLVLRSLTLLVAVGAVSAAAEPVYYWSGDIRIDTTVSLDEVEIENVTAQEHERLTVGGRKVSAVGRSAVRVALADVNDLADLERQVRALGLTGRARAVLGHARAAQPRVLTHELAVGLVPGMDAARLAMAHGCVVLGELRSVPGCFLLAATDAALLAAVTAANDLQESGAVRFATPLIERQHHKRGNPSDPLFSVQWHLRNTGTGQVPGGVAGNDINITSLWDFVGGTHLGTGINVAIVDDGMERTHEDLSANARLDLGVNFNGAPGGPTDPSPGPTDFHGTWTSGLVAARDSNGMGGVGVAPRAKLIGVRLIAAATTEAQDAQGMTYQVSDADPMRRVHVSSNSWGPDDGVVYDTDLSQSALGPLMASALQSGSTSGRGGKGVVYVWAAGNGRQQGYDPAIAANYGGDNLSYDGLASSRFVIAVGALAPNGAQASYSESGPGLLVCAPGGDFSSQGIVTTDRTGKTGTTNPQYSAEDFPGNYTTISGNLVGTSFATPLVSGVVALLLEENPALTWRDVKQVLARSATQNDSLDASWHTNGAGHQHSVRYGFGRVNAAVAVDAAAPGIWVGVPSEAAVLTASESGTFAIPDNDLTGISRTRSITAPPGFHAEHVELVVSASHTFRGNLHFRLTSPSGMVSDFERRELDFGANLRNWMFTSVAHWGENPTGTWTLQVTDEVANEVGSLTAWSLRIHGYLAHPAPTLSAVSPIRIAQNAPATTITCSGTGFAVGATRLRWNGTDLVTTVVSNNQATAVVPPGSLSSAGSHAVTVANPGFDGEATQVSAGITVTVDAPPSIVALTPSPASTPEDTPVALTVTVADSDTTAGSLVFSASSSNQAVIANGNLVFSGSGFTRTVTATPVPDANGTVTLTVTVSDGFSSASSSVSVVVTPVRDPPVALGGRFRARVGTLLSDQVYGYGVDGDALSFTLTSPPASGVFSFDANGTFAYTPSNTGLVSFTYTVTADGQTSNPAQTFVTVADDPNGIRPLIVSEPSDEIISVGSAFSYAVSADTRRYLVAPTLFYALVGQPTDMTINSSTGVIAWTADTPDRHVAFGIVVKDTLAGGLDTQTIVLRIAATSATN